MTAERTRRSDSRAGASRHLQPVPDEPSGPRKRGRRQSLADPGTGPVARLGHQLASLKLAAGDPSYDRMCRELGARASKSALSAAARGRDLPSWETTWEFVRCLAGPDQDLEALQADWRTRWEAARGPAPEPAHGLAAAAPPGRPRRTLLTLGAAAVLVAALVGALVLWSGGDGDRADAVVAAELRPLPGDDGAMIDDVTFDDGTVVAPGSVFVKTWLFENRGTVAWENRFLTRQSDSTGNCRSVNQVPIGPTAPGATVLVSVRVSAADRPGACKVFWKVTDRAGLPYFPQKNPPYYEVVVGGP